MRTEYNKLIRDRIPEMITRRGKMFSVTLEGGGQAMVYSNQNQIFLQLRREIPTGIDVLQPSF